MLQVKRLLLYTWVFILLVSCCTNGQSASDKSGKVSRPNKVLEKKMLSKKGKL